MLIILDICTAILFLGILGAIYRLFKGPTLLDRILAFDAMTICVVGIIGLLSIKWGSLFYVELVLVFSLISFAGTVAFVYLNRYFAEASDWVQNKKEESDE